MQVFGVSRGITETRLLSFNLITEKRQEQGGRREISYTGNSIVDKLEHESLAKTSMLSDTAISDAGDDEPKH